MTENEVQVNIKQARRAESMLLEIISRETAACLGEGQPSYASLSEATSQGSLLADEKVRYLFSLLALRAKLREVVETANVEHGIKAKTAEMATLDNKITILERMCDKTPRSDGGYGTEPKTYRAGISPELRRDLESRIRKIRLEIAKLKDKCGGTNSTTKVTLTTADHLALVELGCI